MSLHCPPCPDWTWFGSLEPDTLGRIATRTSEPSNWVKSAYAWLYDRLEPTARSGLPRPIANALGPPCDFVPVLAVSAKGQGSLGFVTVSLADRRTTAHESDVVRSMWQAAETVTAHFRRLDPNLGVPRVSVQLPSNTGGDSGDLATAVATLALLLRGRVADDIVATGCVCQGSIAPVEPTLLPAKIALARRWGYRRLLIAEDQEGIPAVPAIDLRRLPRSLIYGLFSIVKEAIVGPSSESVAQFLAVFDQAAVRGEPCDRDLLLTLEMTEDFVGAASPGLVRHVAHDIRSRAFLHAGRTEEADIEKDQAADCRPHALNMPEGWLGDYLKWQQPAHRAVIALDQARWDAADPDHALADRTLERLLGAIDDRQAGRSDLLAAMFLSNTRARRYDFLGRRLQDIGLLQRAWTEVTRFASMWPDLFEYCARLGMRDSTLRRQHNYCIEILAASQAVSGQLPEPWIAHLPCLWPAEPNAQPGNDPYDVLFFLRWHAITGGTLAPSHIERALRAARTGPGREHARYPWYLIFEAVLRHELGSPTQRKVAAEGLARCCLFQPDLDANSILSVLAIRAARLLDLCGCPHPEPPAPRPSTALADLAEDLRSRPDSVVARTPY